MWVHPKGPGEQRGITVIRPGGRSGPKPSRDTVSDSKQFQENLFGVQN